MDVVKEKGQPPVVKRAVDRLRAMPPAPTPLRVRLEWEPRYGEVSSTGDLAWLTGPFTQRDLTGQRPPGYGAYSSVWRKLPDGTWKVLVDLGGSTPADASTTFAPGFTDARAGQPSRSKDVMPVGEAIKSFGRDACRTFAAASFRLHAEAKAPAVGRDAACRSLESSFANLVPTVVHTGQSGDLAFTLGGYTSACASVSVTHAAKEPRDTFDVFGTQGSIHIENLNLGELRLHAPAGDRLEAHPPNPNLHRPLIDDFADAVLSRRQPAVTGDVGRAVADVERRIYGET